MTGPIAWFDELGKDDNAIAGGKGANLGELTRAGLPVPPGFVITAEAYLHAMDEGGVRDELRDVFAGAAAGALDPATLAESAERLQALVRKAAVCTDLATAITEAYHRLGDDVPVAVRSSATAEDTAGTSFAGMHQTFANVIGDRAVLERVADCWASLYGERVISYRAASGLDAEPAIAVVVQQLVDADRAGVMFTADPSTGETDRIVIEGAFGLGEAVVSGQVEPDTYLVGKDPPRLLQVRVGAKHLKIVRAAGGVAEVAIGEDEAMRQVLTGDEAIALARLGLRVEAHYGEPQDVEWAIAAGATFLVQSRPITTLTAAVAEDAPAEPDRRVLLQGLAASNGVASGRVRVLRTPKEGRRLLDGEVLVAPMTNPDWVPTIRRAAALVTDGGGMTCHAAIVARELRVPCVVGARTATTTLRDGEVVTVDGARGTVLEGVAAVAPTVPAVAAVAAPASSVEPLATRLYVNLAMAEHADEVAAMPVDGVGLLRAEFLVTDALGGEHPRTLLARGGRDEFVASMAASLLRITRAFAPRPVVYRTIDFRTNEFRGLEGGDAFEPVEDNPMIGYRGCYRYIKEPDLFALEL
jgi:pyruvate,water dikinase